MRQPKQACYVFCSPQCVAHAAQMGVATSEVVKASAQVVLGSTGKKLLLLQ